MTTPHRRRGRPTAFDDTTRRAFLDAVTAGMPLGQAVQHVGINPGLPSRHARTDPDFAQQLTDAKAAGRAARLADAPHDESRYTNHGCRCDTCRTAATAARTGRRHTTDSSGNAPPGPTLITLPTTPGSSPTAFSLARAS
ncbi:hypothetical protein [Streptomyces sp. DH12]|uniref:hypothetical protein n=1 Tax=Streptomyces sp. DH12 TaxID=2857010 RepID=UPI001E54BE1E|nr:hypothetical protein [Streptomyces sp. DH12]